MLDLFKRIGELAFLARNTYYVRNLRMEKTAGAQFEGSERGWDGFYPDPRVFFGLRKCVISWAKVTKVLRNAHIYI